MIADACGRGAGFGAIGSAVPFPHDTAKLRWLRQLRGARERQRKRRAIGEAARARRRQGSAD